MPYRYKTNPKTKKRQRVYRTSGRVVRAKPSYSKPFTDNQPTFKMTRMTDKLYQVASNANGVINGIPAVVNKTINATHQRELNMWLLSFRFEELPNDSDFNLFRFYKIDYIDVAFSIKGAQAFPSSTDGYAVPKVHVLHVYNMDASSIPTTLQQMREYSTVKVKYFNKNNRVLKVRIYPKLLNQLSDRSGQLVESPSAPTFVPLNEKTVEHQGLLINFDTSSSSSGAGDTRIMLEAKYHFTLKGTK